MPHQPRHIGSLAERGAADHVQISEAGQAQRGANSIAASLLDIAKEFRGIAKAQASKKG